MSNELLVFNGINGGTGRYLLPPLPPEAISEVAQGQLFDEQHVKELKRRVQQRTQTHYGVRAGIDPTKLDQTGWGVIFAHNADPAIREALRELLDHRRDQATRKKEHYYKEFVGPLGYRNGKHQESKQDFLARQGAGSGPADPENVPYYLLIVGDPEQIPYRFQYQLDVQYAVGRIHFDTLEEYARYARSVVEAERGPLALPRRAAFVGVRNTDDGATTSSADYLVRPLVEAVRKDKPDWDIQAFLADEAKKSRLVELLGGPQTPSLLFTASHGVAFDLDHPRQRSHQGALLCQEWPGPKDWEQDQPIPSEFYVSADDIGDDARLLGLVAFHFACFGAGTPKLDDFAYEKVLLGMCDDKGLKTRDEIAPRAFVASLPRRLLAHPKGGALAVVGHIDRAWGYSFLLAHGTQLKRQTQTFEDTLKLLMEGHPIGSALECFNERYAELSTDLSTELDGIKFGKIVDDLALAGMWISNNDARSYVILGDPAVRLAASTEPAEGALRPTITAITLGQSPASHAATSSATGDRADGGAVDSAASLPEGAPDSVSVTAPSTAGSTQGLGQSFILGFGRSRETTEAEPGFVTGVQEMAQKLVDWLKNAIEDASCLEVHTYTSGNLEGVREVGGQLTGAELRALTRIRLDGDTLVCVPEGDGEVDTALWAIHSEMVARAQAHRVEMLKTAGSIAAEILQVLKL